MKTETVKLSKLKLNPDNPRTFTDYNKSDMIKSLLCFPEMYKLRPIVIKDNYPLGGNLRLLAFKEIAKMELTSISNLIGTHTKDKSIERITYLVEFWQNFIEKKEIEVLLAENLTEQQQKEFIIRDNVSIGSWNFDVLANEWSTDELKDWGLDLPVWENDDNFSDKNKEIDTNDFKETLTLNFELKKIEYDYAIDYLSRLNGNKELALLEVLNYES